MLVSQMVRALELAVHWFVPFALGVALWAFAQTALGQDAVSEAAAWSAYCDPDESAEGACYVAGGFSCTAMVQTVGIQGFCKVGDDPQFEDESWPYLLCESYTSDSGDDCFPVSESVVCTDERAESFRQSMGGNDGGPPCSMSSGVTVTGDFVVPLSFGIDEGADDGGWPDSVVGLVVIAVVGFGVLVLIRSVKRRSRSPAAAPETEATPEPAKNDSVRPPDVTVTARAENWKVIDASEVGLVRPPDGG